MDADGMAVTRRRVVLFVACSLTGALLVTAVIAATGGLEGSPVLVPGTPLTLAMVLVAVVYMFTPTLAHLLVRRLTGEGWTGVRALLHLRGGWRVWMLAWFAPAVATLVGAAVFYAVSPGAFDPRMTAARDALGAALPAGASPPVDPLVLVAAQVLASLTIAPVINAIFAFGEEFGWRGYLQPKLLELMSPSRALLVLGVIWGAWHWPLIVLGYEYGTGYRGAPWLGCALFVVFTTAVGTLLGWLTARTGSVLPAAVGHGAVNATAGLGALFLAGQPDLLVGPLPIGIIGCVGYVLAAVLLARRWPRHADTGAPPPRPAHDRTVAA